MGNDHGFSSEYNFFRKDHKEIQQVRNQWGNVIFLQSKFSKQHRCVEKILRFTNDEDYHIYRRILQSFQNFKSSSFAKILSFSEGNEGFCANPGLTMAIILECPQSSLQDVILKQNEIQSNELKFLDQDDFLTIFNQLLDLFHSLHLFDLPLGDICPDNIFITEEGDIKYINSYILTGKKTSTDSLNFNQDFTTTYSPEEFLILKFKTQSGIYDLDMEKKSIFAFGITMLSLISSQDYRVFYDFEDFNIKFDKITKILNKLEEQDYNQQLDQILIEMLSREPYERPTFSEIKRRLDQMKQSGHTRLSMRFMSKVNQIHIQQMLLKKLFNLIQVQKQ